MALVRSKFARVYLAASWPRRWEMRKYASQLEELGYEVTSRWIHIDGEEASPEEKSAAAVRDLFDVGRSDILCLFADKPSSSGAYHTEFGMATVWNLQRIVIGKPTTMPMNLFYQMPGVKAFASFDEAMKEHFEELSTLMQVRESRLVTHLKQLSEV